MTCTTRKANFIECDSLNCKNMKCQNKFISGRGNYKLIITKQGSQGMGVKLGQNDRIDENIFIGEYWRVHDSLYDLTNFTCIHPGG